MARLGDGDLGVNLTRAASRLLEDLPNMPDDVGMALLRCAQAFTRVSASTYGTLIATGLMAAAKCAKGRTAVPWTEVPDLLGAALTAMTARGKGQLGDKTVLDALEAARAATEGLSEPAAMVEAARAAIAGRHRAPSQSAVPAGARAHFRRQRPGTRRSGHDRLRTNRRELGLKETG